MTDLVKAEAARNAAKPRKPRRKVRATPPCKDLEPPPGGWRTPNADKASAQKPVAWRCRWKSEPDWKYGDRPCSTKDLARDEPGFEEQALCLEIGAAQLRWALELQEKAEAANVNCDECGGEEIPELCPKCFPLYDDARLARRAALALSSQERQT